MNINIHCWNGLDRTYLDYAVYSQMTFQLRVISELIGIRPARVDFKTGSNLVRLAIL